MQMAAKFTYAAYGIGFAIVPSEYQWMLGVASPRALFALNVEDQPKQKGTGLEI